MELAKRKVPRVLLAAAAAGAIGAGTGAWAVASSSPEPLTVPASGPAPSYQKNPSGESYGSAAVAPAPAQEPDLILVIADDGQEGYVRKVQLDPPAFESPEAALQWQENVGSKVRVLPVFESDGEKRIGSFTIDPKAGEEVAVP